MLLTCFKFFSHETPGGFALEPEAAPGTMASKITYINIR